MLPMLRHYQYWHEWRMGPIPVMVIVPVLALHNVAVEVAVAVAATPLPMVTSRVNIQPSSFWP